MVMEIYLINNKNFTKFYLKIRVREKKFHNVSFLVESKPHERIDLLITTIMNIFQTRKEKKNLIVMKHPFLKKNW